MRLLAFAFTIVFVWTGPQVVRESHFGCPRNAQVISSEALGTMPKNDLRRITLVRGPICGIRSLNLIISCS